MSKILIIDDDHHICKALVKRFKRMDHEADYSLSLHQGLDKLFSHEFDIVFLDVNFPDGNGLEAIATIQDHPFAPEIIIMTGDSDPEGAELAMKSRAWDYIQKSGSHKDFEFSLIRALEYRQQKQSKIQQKIIKREAIIGQSQQIKTCLENILKASNNDVPILITGETGTGKELFAKAIHENSLRRPNDFIVVDCAALPEHLVESVLFGHSKGAFTGADSDKVGLIKLADKGSLFLDEVGELPLTIQKKFLRALQEKRFRPVGSKKEISSNFRLIAATHRDVSKMVKQDRFRQDFYFRIASLTIEIPPLRNRRPDIPLLVEYHMDRKNKLFNESPHKISSEFMKDLLGYDWPGNVRELFNTIDYACSDAFEESMLFQNHLPDHIRAFNIKTRIKKSKGSGTKQHSSQRSAPVESLNLKDYIEKMKHKYVTDLMSSTCGDIKTACRLSGLSRGHLYSLLKKYDISSS
ncbi:MAG: sigma-54-dependent Fis family transcriptional regulator [Desulfobacula sp.]|nr:sigma-54-dependent Fis family transcriptional regulator [Desulfobacula sp.]